MTNQQPEIKPHTYTEIEDVGFQCNDCGAYAPTPEEVVHYPTCKPGESDRWQRLPDAVDERELDAYEEGSLGLHWDEPVDDDPSPYEGTYSEE